MRPNDVARAREELARTRQLLEDTEEEAQCYRDRIAEIAASIDNAPAETDEPAIRLRYARAVVALADELDRNALAVPPSIEAIVAEARAAVPRPPTDHD